MTGDEASAGTADSSAGRTPSPVGTLSRNERWRRRALALCLAAVLSSFPASAGAAEPPLTLVNEAGARGVRFVQKNFATEMKYPFETLGGAVAALDYDNDGWVDLLFLNGAPSPGARAQRSGQLQPPVPEHGQRAFRRRDRSSRD